MYFFHILKHCAVNCDIIRSNYHFFQLPNINLKWQRLLVYFFFRKKKFLKQIKRGAKSWRPNYYFLSECYLFALIYIWLFNDRFWLKMDWFSMKFATSDIVINVLVQQNKKTRFWFHASYNTMYVLSSLFQCGFKL